MNDLMDISLSKIASSNQSSIETGNEGLPDVAATEKAQISGTLDWVGMSGIALPIRIRDQYQGDLRCESRVQTCVSLDLPETKGIHMSRLYLLLEQFCTENVLQPKALTTLLNAQQISHSEMSAETGLQFGFDVFLQRPALKSKTSGWKAYPVTLKALLNADQDKVQVELSVTASYSSTCPCSASLSRQLTEQAMQKAFSNQAVLTKEDVSAWLLSEQGSFATPHSQRSLASVTVRLDDQLSFLPITSLIDQIENALATPVQTAVKRQDEQEFARLNGHNLMFCEDAARRIRKSLLQQPEYLDFCLKVEHQESLHAHDAIAMASKGISGGLKSELNMKN